MTTKSTTPKKPTPAKQMAVINFSWGASLAMPTKDAAQIMSLLENAERFETGWEVTKTIEIDEDGNEREKEDSVKVCYVGGKMPEITMTMLSEHEWVLGKLKGAKPE